MQMNLWFSSHLLFHLFDLILISNENKQIGQKIITKAGRTGGGHYNTKIVVIMSFGRSRCTGPFLPVLATLPPVS
jgi:hypothetical protein